MSAWSDLTEEQKDTARARYRAMAKNGLGPVTVLGITVEPGPMDPAAAQGITEDEYLERLYAQAPKILALAEKLGPILARIGGKK